MQYWDVPEPGTAEPRPDRRLDPECRQRLEEAVETRLMSDVPLGMFLSGGVDSSAIAALIRRKTSGAVKTFSVGYREAEFSELSYAAEVARTIGTEHHETVIGMEDFFQALPDLIWHEDEPIPWPSSVSLYFVSKLAAQQVKVVLTGEGADELFGGYKRYAWQLLNERGMRYYGMIPRELRSWVRERVATSSMLSAIGPPKIESHISGARGESRIGLPGQFLRRVFGGAADGLLGREPAGVYGDYLRYWSSRPQASSLQRMLYADQKTYLVELLMKQDQMSMACSIESRVPFLDHPFVEFAMRVPDRLKIHGNTQKYILKKAVEDLIPHEILYRKKMGFPTPLSAWFRDPKAKPLWKALCARDGFLGGYLNLDAVRSLIERQCSGFEDATDRLWRLLNLQIWGDIFITGREERWREGALASESAASESMKLLWVKTDFLHPTTRGGQIRTLECCAACTAGTKSTTLLSTIRASRRVKPRGRVLLKGLPDRLPSGGQGVTRVPGRAVRGIVFAAAGGYPAVPVGEDAMPNRAADPTGALRSRVCDFLSPAPNIPDLSSCVLFQHNVEAVIWKRRTEHAPDRLRRLYLKLQAERMYRYEGEVCRKRAESDCRFRNRRHAHAGMVWSAARGSGPHRGGRGLLRGPRSSSTGGGPGFCGLPRLGAEHRRNRLVPARSASVDSPAEA